MHHIHRLLTYPSLACVMCKEDTFIINQDQEKLYITHLGVWPGPQKVNLKCGKILNQDSTVYYSRYETKTSFVIDVFSGNFYFLLVSSLLCFLFVLN